MPGYIRDHDGHPPLDSPGYGSTAPRQPRRPPTPLPHASTGITAPSWARTARQSRPRPRPPARGGAPGRRVIVHGPVPGLGLGVHRPGHPRRIG
ncbi:hypothetical protein ACFW53_09400 [Nocardiopsis dassonvillei]|uniref:hypothetical protein n=1 Tax=Nocardiopsis dassonvillei TaxID=2014 RepID=UPI0036705633